MKELINKKIWNLLTKTLPSSKYLLNVESSIKAKKEKASRLST
jgi:hypothetical protein